MRYIILAIVFVLLVPTYSHAESMPSSFYAARSLVFASSSPGNAYVAGLSVVRTASVTGDFVAFGGSIITAAPVSDDELLIAGSIHSRAHVGDDLRAIGWNILIDESVGGDLVALGYSVNNSSLTSGATFIIAANAILNNGASGPVTVYGNNVYLFGNFADNVDIFASGRVTVAADTTIAGKLSYQAPEPATIHPSATVLGGIDYSIASYLPDAGTSRMLAYISIGFFLFVRILGALILAGLLAGLFPRFAETFVERAYTASAQSILLTMLLGFAVFIVTPILVFLLAITFIGIGLSILLFITYILIVFLAFMYAGILIGGIFARRYLKRKTILWRDGVFGMLIFSLVSLVPFAGLPIVFLFTFFSAGALLLLFFNFAFLRRERSSEML